jgi:hypothetical protein
MMGVTQAQIRDCLLKRVHQRGAGKTICPSEVARSLGGDDWRDLMPLVREVGTALTVQGQIVTLQKGQRVDPSQVRGPIRYGLPGGPA